MGEVSKNFEDVFTNHHKLIGLWHSAFIRLMGVKWEFHLFPSFRPLFGGSKRKVKPGTMVKEE